jgi:hypothetical protein
MHPQEAPVVELGEAVLGQEPVELISHLALDLHAHVLEVLLAVGEREAHPCEQQLELLEAVVSPRLEPGGDVGGAEHGVEQAPLPQQHEPRLVLVGDAGGLRRPDLGAVLERDDGIGAGGVEVAEAIDVLLELHDGGLVARVGDAVVDELVGEGDAGEPEELVGVPAQRVGEVVHEAPRWLAVEGAEAVVLPPLLPEQSSGVAVVGEAPESESEASTRRWSSASARSDASAREETSKS